MLSRKFPDLEIEQNPFPVRFRYLCIDIKTFFKIVFSMLSLLNTEINV